MFVLEARFHPQKRNGTGVIVVGRVYCDGDRSWVSAGEQSDGAMVSKLRYLVTVNSPHPYQKLLTLTSDYWSFVDVKELEGKRP